MAKSKITGFCEMKKRKGKVVFTMDEESAQHIVGLSTDKLFLYDDVSDKVTKESLGKYIEPVYNRGYNGSAVITDVIIK